MQTAELGQGRQSCGQSGLSLPECSGTCFNAIVAIFGVCFVSLASSKYLRGRCLATGPHAVERHMARASATAEKPLESKCTAIRGIKMEELDLGPKPEPPPEEAPEETPQLAAPQREEDDDEEAMLVVKLWAKLSLLTSCPGHLCPFKQAEASVSSLFRASLQLIRSMPRTS